MKGKGYICILQHGDIIVGISNAIAAVQIHKLFQLQERLSLGTAVRYHINEILILECGTGVRK